MPTRPIHPIINVAYHLLYLEGMVKVTAEEVVIQGDLVTLLGRRVYFAVLDVSKKKIICDTIKRDRLNFETDHGYENDDLIKASVTAYDEYLQAKKAKFDYKRDAKLHRLQLERFNGNLETYVNQLNQFRRLHG